jgi:hypothetical protein
MDDNYRQQFLWLKRINITRFMKVVFNNHEFLAIDNIAFLKKNTSSANNFARYYILREE